MFLANRINPVSSISIDFLATLLQRPAFYSTHLACALFPFPTFLEPVAFVI
jgi:hypothetical protein